MTEVLALAGRKVSLRLRDLLPFHKASLLAIERGAANEVRNAVSASSTVLESFRVSRVLLRASALTAYRAGVRHAAAEFTALGLEVPSRLARPPAGFLNQALTDLRRSLYSRDLAPAVKAHRAAVAASVVTNRAYSDGQRAMYEAAAEADASIELHKVWVTNLEAGSPPCRFCLRLDGQSVPLGQEFRAPSGLKVYADLQGPPAHPHCRCRVVVRVVRKNKPSAARSDG